MAANGSINASFNCSTNIGNGLLLPVSAVVFNVLAVSSLFDSKLVNASVFATILFLTTFFS